MRQWSAALLMISLGCSSSDTSAPGPAVARVAVTPDTQHALVGGSAVFQAIPYDAHDVRVQRF